MTVLKDLVGRRFSRLVVVQYAGQNRHRKSIWNCLCDCGKSVQVVKGSLKSGNTRSCGCLHIDTVTTHGATRRATGWKNRGYSSWLGMLQRCFNERDPDYHHYGGRGISVCNRWTKSFAKFIEDMGPMPPGLHSIDRVDNSGNYEPGNCRWATKKQQDRNKRSNRVLEYQGTSLCLTEWAERMSIHPATLYARLHKGWTVEDALNKPVRRRA